MLFRRQVVEAQRTRLLGRVLIATPISFWVTTTFLIALIVALIVFLAMASFSRIEMVRGAVVPSSGIVEVYAPGGGILSDFSVREGDNVEQGQVIGRVTASAASGGDGTRMGAELASIITNIVQIEERLDQTKNVTELEIDALESRRVELTFRIENSEQRLGFQEQLLHEVEQSAARVSQLAEQKLVNAQSKSQQTIDLIRARQDLQRLRSEVHDLRMQYERTFLEQQQVVARARLEQLNLEADRARLRHEQQIIVAAQAYDIMVPVNGTVTAVLVSDGYALSGNRQLLSILPQSGTLQVELYVPSRAIGFVEEGQEVRLLFDAFPYQRFGSQQGVVTEVTSSVIIPNEAQLLIEIGEPVYRVTVEIAAESIAAQGRSLPIHPGMLLSANIVLEDRTLLTWLFEPLLSVTRKN